ncbi:MAG: 16S rRNA (cytosine(967)-C(5))-methyltransferase RsmB [Kiritimatiellales bacterium]|nr:16S rRNA (cytosine(967)-C(5))-methyltransferase RsmB [Kiritimatiellota bacterium]MBL7012101.1 16S rRNA (cytosine(967)-C(5))-methyltransferase RsmB [Kiritimatiellales bacterium]
MRKPNSRYVAAQIITQWMEKGDFPDRLLADVEQDRAFITELVYGVVRRKLTLEYILQKFVNRRPEDFILAVMQVGVYQLCFMDNVEEFAAINESVGAVKDSRHKDALRASGMVNAVLRNVQEEKEAILKNLARQPDEIRTSHPEQLVHRWQKQYGERDTRQLCEWDNVPPETILRVETARISPADFMKALEEAKIDAKPHPFKCLATFVTLPRGVPVPKVPGYNEGWFTVQDPATSASVELLDPMPGESVLDACAAPGGKTSMIAGMMEGEGELVAMDVHDDRLDTLRDTVKRTGWDFIEIVKGDAAKGFPASGKLFDAVLLDVPCTNTGVLRRRADARWRFARDRIEMLKKTQWKILTEMSKCVKPGGRIVYSTCSLEPEENEELVGRWTRKHPEFRLVKAKRLFPPKSGTDGAYAALLRRKK